MKFGDHLKKARMAKGLTQEQVGSYFYVTRQTISSWENETTYPDITNLIKLSDYYQLSLDELIKEDSGMQDYLKKQDVIKSIRPVAILLLVIDLLFLGILVLHILNIIKFSSDVVLILDVFLILNVIALMQISVFQVKLGVKSKLRFSNTSTLIIALILSVLGLLITFLSSEMLIGGILTGTGIASLILSFQAKQCNRGKNN